MRSEELEVGINEPPPAGPGPIQRIALASIAVAAALVVVLGLSAQPADPPHDLSGSLGVLDEGLWSHNSVNAALFGDARLDDLNPMYISSVPPVLMRISYELFGVGIIQTRLPSILCGAAAVLVVGLLWRRRDPTAAIVASWLLATTYLFLAYSRLGLLETTATTFILFGVACLLRGLNRASRAWAFIGGVLIAAGATSKPQAGGAALGALAGITVWTVAGRKQRGREMLALLAGLLGTVAVWATYVGLHLDPTVRAEWRQHALGIGVKASDAFSNASAYLKSSDGFGSHAGPLLIAAAVGVAVQLAAWIIRRHKPDELQWASAGWAAAAVATIAAISYRPSRYAVTALPGLAMVAGGGVAALREMSSGRAKQAITALAIAGTVAASAIGLSQWAAWHRKAEWSIRDVARTLARTTRPGDVIAGGWALIPATQAHRRVVVPLPLTGLDVTCVVERRSVDWVLIATGDRVGHDFYNRTYPGLLTRANLASEPRLYGYGLALYRVPAGLRSAAGC